MKQIFSWTVGSFFRTIGRIAAFMIIGFVIAKLVDFSGLIDSFKITDLFLERVDALTLTSEVQKTGDGFFTVSNPQYWVDEPSTYFKTYTSLATTQVDSFDFNSPLNTSDSDYVTFNFKLGIPSTTTQSQQSTFENTQCRRFYCSSYDLNGYCAKWYCDQWYVADTNYNYSIATNNYDIDKLNFYFRVYYENNGGWNSCSFTESEIVCPTSRKNISSLQMHVLYNTSATSTIKVGVVRGWNKWKNVNVVGAIESQTQQQHQDAVNQQQQQQQQHNELMDTNSTQTDETSSSFFGNFTTEDQGGLSSIVTAPLSMINELLNGQCTQPSATWKGATISLPCGDMFWNRNGASSLKDLLNVFYGGFICYYAIRKLFLMIESFKDPTNDRIEVSDL